MSVRPYWSARQRKGPEAHTETFTFSFKISLPTNITCRVTKTLHLYPQHSQFLRWIPGCGFRIISNIGFSWIHKIIIKIVGFSSQLCSMSSSSCLSMASSFFTSSSWVLSWVSSSCSPLVTSIFVEKARPYFASSSSMGINTTFPIVSTFASIICFTFQTPHWQS